MANFLIIGGLMQNNLENFGIDTFGKRQMKKSLPYPIYLKWKNATRKEELLDMETADLIAHAMKEWAMERGATHYTHWFQPLNGKTAKKHDAFLDRTYDNKPIHRFSAKELIKGEPDASSFPTGSMRSTFEARGYTYWDVTSYAFIIDHVFYIPSIFVSYDGKKLDKKLPLLNSLDELSEKATLLYNKISKDKCYRMRVKLGLEQEFFLIDQKIYENRIDLVNTGRTLIGRQAPKDQELTDHYFGSIPQRILEFYNDVNDQLYQLGIYAKTEHNEAAPNQFEIAVLFENANIAVDNNHLVMEIICTTAKKHGLVCLLHEKPFQGINGSGKHNNYSLVTNYGRNVFEPVGNMEDDKVFLLFTACLVEAVDKGQGMLRYASSDTSNDYRLGGLEAPPAIISMDLGDDIEETFHNITCEDKDKCCVSHPSLNIQNVNLVQKNMTDRNRTSPFAYTGNKFEFRMLGSSKSASDVNIAINIYFAQAISRVYDRLKDVKKDQLDDAIIEEIKYILDKHGRILYHNDNYTEVWKKEASKRGLKCYYNFFESIEALIEAENIEAYSKIYTKAEIEAMYKISLEDVIKTHRNEAKTLTYMLDKWIIPAASKQISDNYKLINNTKIESFIYRNSKLENLFDSLLRKKEELEDMLDKKDFETIRDKAEFHQYSINSMMEEIREIHDEMEAYISKENYKLYDIQDIYSCIY